MSTLPDASSGNDRFYMLGDSHVASFLGGAREAGGEDLVTGGGWGSATSFLGPFFDIVDGRIVPYEDFVYYELWKQNTGKDLNDCPGRLILSMGLAVLPAMGRPSWRSFGADRAPITRTLFNAIVDDLQTHVLAFYDALIERGLLAAVYDPPPPSADHLVLRRARKDFLDIVGERYRAPVLERIERANLPLIRLPVAGEDGFLDPRYASSDLAHAGPSIGPLVVDALRALKKGQ